MSNAPEVRPAEETMMTETRPKAAAARIILSALLTLLAVALSSPSEVRAQWTTPDSGGHIGNTNPGSVRVGGEGKLKVATTGRVRVRVDASRGGILVGDLLATSEVEARR